MTQNCVTLSWSHTQLFTAENIYTFVKQISRKNLNTSCIILRKKRYEGGGFYFRHSLAHLGLHWKYENSHTFKLPHKKFGSSPPIMSRNAHHKYNMYLKEACVSVHIGFVLDWQQSSSLMISRRRIITDNKSQNLNTYFFV